MTDEPNPVLVAFGWLLVVLGVLWTFLAGSCTLYVVGASVVGMAQGGSSSGMAGMLPLALLVGAAGIVPGALILWAGSAILRGQRRRIASAAAEQA